MYGISCDTIRREYKTKNQKGPAPYWGHDSEKFRFRKIVAPQMAMIRFTVYDDVRNKVTRFYSGDLSMQSNDKTPLFFDNRF